MITDTSCSIIERFITRFWIQKERPEPGQMVFGILAGPDNQMYYAGARDIYPDAASFERLCEAMGALTIHPALSAWSQYAATSHPERSPQIKLCFKPTRYAIPVWCSPIQHKPQL